MTDSLDLDARAGLPAELRLLLGDYPRKIWGDHPNFGPVTRFYLDRHAMFREAMAVLAGRTEAALGREIAPEAFARDFARVANHLLGELTMHHHIEDASYFPALVRLEPRLARGFDMLEADHAAIHAALEGFQADGNALLRALAGGEAREALGGMRGALGRMERLLDRHLADEEELVVPIMLDRGEAALEF